MTSGLSSWFRRRRPDEPDAAPADPAAAPPAPADGDSPEQLRDRLRQLIRYVNANAGALPVEAVVVARGITDTIHDVIDTGSDRALDVYAIVSVNGIVGDYLPTTLRAYLNLDRSQVDQPNAAGRTPRAALREQLDALAGAADELLQAARSFDADAIFTQGNFLRTKFSRSDLDL